MAVLFVLLLILLRVAESQILPGTLAGNTSAHGYADGTAALFNEPTSIAIGPNAAFALIVSAVETQEHPRWSPDSKSTGRAHKLSRA